MTSAAGAIIFGRFVTTRNQGLLYEHGDHGPARPDGALPDLTDHAHYPLRMEERTCGSADS